MMTRSPWRPFMMLLLLIAVPSAFAVDGYRGLRADRRFGAQAELVRQSASGVLSWKRRLSPAELQTWEARIAADARRAARRLRPAQKRQLALRWLETQRRLRRTRVSIWAAAERRAQLEVYRCREVALGAKIPAREQPRFIRSCLRKARGDFDRETEILKRTFAQLESEAGVLWTSLVTLAPAIVSDETAGSP